MQVHIGRSNTYQPKGRRNAGIDHPHSHKANLRHLSTDSLLQHRSTFITRPSTNPWSNTCTAWGTHQTQWSVPRLPLGRRQFLLVPIRSSSMFVSNHLWITSCAVDYHVYCYEVERYDREWLFWRFWLCWCWSLADVVDVDCIDDVQWLFHCYCDAEVYDCISEYQLKAIGLLVAASGCVEKYGPDIQQKGKNFSQTVPQHWIFTTITISTIFIVPVHTQFQRNIISTRARSAPAKK